MGGGGGGRLSIDELPIREQCHSICPLISKMQQILPFNSLATGFKLEIIEGQGWGWKNRSDASHHVSPSPLGLPLPPLLRK